MFRLKPATSSGKKLEDFYAGGIRDRERLTLLDVQTNIFWGEKADNCN